MPSTPLDGSQLWFRSSLFRIEPGEDARNNPGCHGRALANWVAGALAADGVAVEGVLPEDWGWCVLVKKRPVRLWLGCGQVNGREPQGAEDAPAAAADVVWTCFAVAEVPVFQRLFCRPSWRPDVVDLLERVKRLLAEAPGTTFVEEP